MSQFNAPQLPFMPFGGGPGSAAGSDYGHVMTMPPQLSQIGYQNMGSTYGMLPPAMAPRNTMMMGMGMFDGSIHGSQSGAMPSAQGLHQRPISTFSMATSVNPFAGPSINPNPTHKDLFNALRNYLSTQGLMTVTKKLVLLLHFCNLLLIVCFFIYSRTTREAIMSRFPKADMTSCKDFLKRSIDKSFPNHRRTFLHNISITSNL